MSAAATAPFGGTPGERKGPGIERWAPSCRRLSPWGPSQAFSQCWEGVAEEVNNPISALRAWNEGVQGPPRD